MFILYTKKEIYIIFIEKSGIPLLIIIFYAFIFFINLSFYFKYAYSGLLNVSYQIAIAIQTQRCNMCIYCMHNENGK